MWEENQQYQDAAFKTVMWLVVAGTLVLGVLCFLGGKEGLLGKWITGIGVFVGAWLIIIGIVFLVVRLFVAKAPLKK